MAVPSLEQVVPLAVLGGFFLAILAFWVRYSDRKRKREQEEAEWVRDRVEAWEGGFLGRVEALYRNASTDPSHLKEPLGRKRLDRYCPGLWDVWTTVRDRREERGDKLEGLYNDLLYSNLNKVIDESPILVNGRRLAESFEEDIKRRAKDGIRILFEIRYEKSNLENIIIAGNNNTPIAIGEKGSLQTLLEKITRYRDLPIMHAIIANLIEYRKGNDQDDVRWDGEKRHAIETLETKYSLKARTLDTQLLGV